MAELTPEQRKEISNYERTCDNWARVALAVMPVFIFGPIWWPLRNMIGPEGAVGAVVATQITIVATLSDKVTTILVNRRRAKITKANVKN
ncbi:hypothetical protein [Roseobacter sp. TSBP12]|uniref:hypothetical protein n=1 Tax=Roseobacter sp. TSBP12 TaxID=1236613 RepID=UPI00125FB7F7|nr:hypothetical protein [Roseobacter sp. TSBP12]KAB6717738.1 hypothetical protein C8029_04250 [Roseobacter sp. TSBP12]